METISSLWAIKFVLQLNIVTACDVWWQKYEDRKFWSVKGWRSNILSFHATPQELTLITVKPKLQPSKG